MRRFTKFARLAALVALPLVAACTERIDSGAACPELCPTENVPVRDTVIEAVVLDSTIGGFPLPGAPTFLLLASQPNPDTLDVRSVIRFDSLPRRFFPIGGSDSLPITRVDSSFVYLRVDTASAFFTQPVTITAFDVDTVTTADSSTAVLNRLFRADRLIGSVTIQPGAFTTDTLRVPLSNAVVAIKTRDSLRLRIGFRITSSAPSRLRFYSARGGTSSNGARLSFDPATDTSYTPIVRSPSSGTPPVASVAAGLEDFTIAAAGTLPAPGADLLVGGFPVRRAFLRFNLPARLVDSSTIVRATLLLAQRPVRGFITRDTVQLETDVVLADQSILDLRRSAELTAPGAALGIDSVRLAPADSGARIISLVNLVRAWRTLPTTTQRAIVLRDAAEGAQPSAVRFFSSEASSAALRPRLRISYIPRTEFALP